MNTARTRTLLAAPLLVVLALLTACGADAGSEAGDPTSVTSTSSSPGDATDDATGSGTLALVADGSVTAKCAVPSAETLATFDTAFSGTVTSIDDGTATLEVDRWYAGGEEPTVTVASPSKALEDLLMAVDFEVGKTYLVSATDTRVTLCGFTAEQNPELETLYAEAYEQ